MARATNLAAQSLLGGDQFVAELDPRLAERLAEPHHLGAQLCPRADDTSPILGNLLREEPNLAADFGELSDHLAAQRVDPPAETRDRLDHQIESRAELFEHRAYPGHRFVRHLTLPLGVNARACRIYPT